MARKFEVTGKAVLYTRDGVEIVDAEVRRKFNNHMDTCEPKTGEIQKPFILVGCARTVPTDNVYAQAAYNPERLTKATEYASTKFFRLMLDLMRCAQWEPIHPNNRMIGTQPFSSNRGDLPPTDDRELYKLYDFTPAMIQFVEERYHDELCRQYRSQAE